MNKGKKNAIRHLKTVRGQIDGIINMIEDGRYCVDVSNQIFASSSLLKKANLEILKQHMENCVSEAFEEGKGGEKMDEIMLVLSKVMDK